MKDLTKGNPYKLIVLFALPVFAGYIFQQLYNMVDTIIVGNTVSAAALTGVGATGPLTFLIFGFVNGLTAGFSVRVAQRFGAGDKDGVKRAVAMSYMLGAAIAVLMTALAVPLTGSLLHMMNTPAEYFDYAYSYLFVVFCGISATVFYNLITGILRAIGDSKTPLYFLIASAFLNVGLDFAFIVGFKMHYIGAALATVLSQVLAGVVCFIYMLIRYPDLRVKRADFRWDWRLAGGHVAVGVPMALQFSITAVGCIFQQTALNGLNDTVAGAVTAYAAASKIDTLANQSLVALGTAMATFAGQNSGAERYDRVQKGVHIGVLYAAVCAAIGIAFSAALGKPLMHLFLNAETDPVLAERYDAVLSLGYRYLLIRGAFYFPLGLIHIYRNALQGIGKSALAMIAGVTELAGRSLASFVLVDAWGFLGVILSDPTAWICADLFLIVTYYIVMAKIFKRNRGTAAPKSALPASARSAQ